jgi:cell fate regulator YaaT (PSP1 superfamily)
MARPSTYSFELAKEICERVSNGESIKYVLDSKDEYPTFPTWCKWKRDNQELLSLYIRAREDKAESVDDKIDDVIRKIESGQLDPAQGRVIIDALKWKASKYYPKMFGDSSKVDVTTNGKDVQQSIDPNLITKLIDKL